MYDEKDDYTKKKKQIENQNKDFINNLSTAFQRLNQYYFDKNMNQEKDGNENNIVEKSNYHIKSPKFIDIKTFKIDFFNFADDCCLAMRPMIKKCQLTNIIKYKFRLNLQ